MTSKYMLWNDAITSHFFNSDVAGSNVNLYVSQRLISALEDRLRGKAGKFIEAIHEGPANSTQQGLCQQALHVFEDWRKSGYAFPPYVAYLALFVLAAGTEGDFAPNDYYDRLRLLVGLNGKGTIPSFHRMRELWGDLEKWSIEDKNGDLGIFHARQVGGNIHIAYPLAQTILSEQERRVLPQIFSFGSLDPTMNPPSEELNLILRRFGQGRLRARTLKLLDTRYDQVVHDALLSTVSDELAEWDGLLAEVEEENTNSQMLLGLRLCIEKVDLTAEELSCTLRCKTNHDLPDDGITLSISGTTLKLVARDYIAGWSSHFQYSTTGETADAAQFDWITVPSFVVENGKWKARLQSRQIRIFTDGSSEYLPGLIESQSLPKGLRFFIAFHQDVGQDIRTWATSECEGFVEHPILRGLPTGWRLASVQSAKSDAFIKSLFPYMSFPSGIRLRLVGGLRNGQGNNYFEFALPDVIVDGNYADVVVFCENKQLQSINNSSIFPLPDRLQAGKRIVIKGSVGESQTIHQSLFLTRDFEIKMSDNPNLLDRFGLPIRMEGHTSTFLQGASLFGNASEKPNSILDLEFEDIELEIGNNSAVLVGQQPGQIMRWSAKPVSTGWKPVWLVVKKTKRRSTVIFIGSSVTESNPITSLTGSQRDIRNWRKTLWHKRLRMKVFGNSSIRNLWRKYQEVARDVRPR